LTKCADNRLIKQKLLTDILEYTANFESLVGYQILVSIHVLRINAIKLSD